MVDIICNPQPAAWAALCQRAVFDDSLIEGRVRTILARVREGGDDALRAITTEIDGACPDSFFVSEAEFERASTLVIDALKEAIRRAKTNIETDEHGRDTIVVTEVPYMVNKKEMISHIAELVREPFFKFCLRLIEIDSLHFGGARQRFCRAYKLFNKRRR